MPVIVCLGQNNGNRPACWSIFSFLAKLPVEQKRWLMAFIDAVSVVGETSCQLAPAVESRLDLTLADARCDQS